MTILLYVASIICGLDIAFNIYKYFSSDKTICVNTLSDLDKVTANRVSEVKSSGTTYYIRIAGPLNFDIIGAWRDEKASQEEKCIKILAACICNKMGEGLFNPEDPKHIKKIKNLPVDDQAILLSTVLNFFHAKKK